MARLSTRRVGQGTAGQRRRIYRARSNDGDYGYWGDETRGPLAAAFPNTPILDDFNTGGAQALTARAGWGSSAFLTTQTSFTTNATPTTADGSSPGGNNWAATWTDMEAYCTLAAWSGTTDEFLICARIQAFGASPTYYAIDLGNIAATGVELIKVVAGARTQLASTTNPFTNGDSYGIDVLGTTITAYYRSGAGVWQQLLQTTDSSITGLGSIGFRHILTSSVSIDNFGGGDLSPAAKARVPIVVRRTWAGR